MRDTEGALDALSRELRGNDALQSELASAYLAIGLAKGPYNATGSEGDPAEAARYVHKSVDLYSALARSKPGDESVRRGQLEALSTLLHLQYRIGSTGESKHTAREIDQQIARMPAALAKNAQVRWYQSIAYLEMGSILWNEGATAEALENQRKALAAFREGVPIAVRQDPEKLEHWSHLQRELAISIWMFQGIGPEAIGQGRRAVEVLTGCDAPSCRMRHAQSLGTLGEMEWASGDQDRGIATLRQSVAEFESLLADDLGNAVLVNAGAQVRSYLALAGSRRQWKRSPSTAERTSPPAVKTRRAKGPWRPLVYRIT
jgi:tetratricopeptide (TPR) repeat protein